MDEEDRAAVRWLAAGLAAATLLAYLPILAAGFLNYDDPLYVTANSHVRAGLSLEGARWALTSFDHYNWSPVTWFSHMLDVEVFGLRPGGHHFVNLLLHVANGLLLFGLLRRATGTVWRSACVAAFFALHPLHVESVAWVAERKDVLSTFFGFLALLAYVRYTRSRSVSSYVLSLCFFALGLMAKQMLVTVPFVLLLLDYWPLRRFEALGPSRWGELRRLATEKVPYLLFSLASSAVTFAAQSQGGAVRAHSPLLENVSNAFVSYVRYTRKMFWPADLAVFYPYRPGDVSAWEGLLALAALAALTWGVLRLGRRRPYLSTGWFWYLVTLAPVVGFVKIGDHAMADRYTYVPLIGLFVAVVWGAADLARRFALSRRVAAGATLAALAACAGLTHAQARTWKDSETLFRRALAVTKDNWVAHKNLGAAVAQRGNLEEALFHVSESVRIWPEPREYVSQGWLYLQLGQYEKAAGAARKSLTLLPADNDRAHFILGMSSAYLGDSRSVSSAYETLRRSNPRYASQLEPFMSGGPGPGRRHGQPEK